MIFIWEKENIMGKQEQPNFYAILPATIRYSEDLSEFQKLLYAEITALANKNGYCFASNSYFAWLYKKSNTWVSKSINTMAKLWYLEIEREQALWNIRKIFIWELKKMRKQVKKAQKEAIEEKDKPIEVEFNPIEENFKGGIEEKCKTPIEENFKHNITSNNTTSVNREEKKQIPSTHKNLDFINWMRDVEIRGNNWLIKWNSLTSREDLMNSWVKKELFWIMKNVPFETFEKRVANFKKILDLIEVHSLKPFLYFDVWDRDFEKFIKSINKFYWTPNEIFCKLSHREYKSRVLRLISKPQKAQEEEKEEKKPLSEAEKKERQKRLRAIQEKILSN